MAVLDEEVDVEAGEVEVDPLEVELVEEDDESLLAARESVL